MQAKRKEKGIVLGLRKRPETHIPGNWSDTNFVFGYLALFPRPNHTWLLRRLRKARTEWMIERLDTRIIAPFIGSNVLRHLVILNPKSERGQYFGIWHIFFRANWTIFKSSFSHYSERQLIVISGRKTDADKSPKLENRNEEDWLDLANNFRHACILRRGVHTNWQLAIFVEDQKRLVI